MVWVCYEVQWIIFWVASWETTVGWNGSAEQTVQSDLRVIHMSKAH
jgi:hypothetical protein